MTFATAGTSRGASITVAMAGELWIERAVRHQLVRSTVRQYRQHLDHHIGPVRGMKIAKAPAEEGQGDAVEMPTKEELRAILDKATGRWRPLIVTTMFTGMRGSELRGRMRARRRQRRGQLARHPGVVRPPPRAR